jgi:vacuolar protein sorting-associated protein 72
MADLMEDDLSLGLQSSEEEEEVEMPVESLVSGRAKRSTAGRHMSALIDAAADDDLTLLFEEVEDDNEFAIDAGAAEEEDMGLDSSSEDEDDQGPDAQNDYEGEKQLQKEERKKRRAQNDLRFQTLRKRVKIDPTAISSMPAPPPRAKKKSERISWLPTVEDGPTRSSSRRQTMVNKELTHARLKDSQEKRIRIIATMKEAEKRKAHLKPKEMTQEDHLAEAARVERTNSKSLNRWELSERKKAEERKAKIEALQNRRLEGPVLSYWSGVATWVDGKLTKVGKVEIKAKTEKEEPRKKKKDKDEKTATESQSAQSATPAPVPQANTAAPGDASTSIPTAVPGEPGALPASEAKPQSQTPVATTSAPDTVAAPTSTQEPPSKPSENPSEPPVTASQPVEKDGNKDPEQQPAAESIDSKKKEAKTGEPETQADPSKVSEKQTEPGETVTGHQSTSPAEQDTSDKPAETSSTEKSEEKSEENPDVMDIDSGSGTEPIKVDGPQPPIERESPAAAALNGIGTSTDAQPTSGEVSQTTLASSTTEPVTEHVTPAAAASAPAPTPADPQAPQAQAQAPPSNAAPLQATPPNIPETLNQGVDQPQQTQQGPQGDLLLQQPTQSQDSISTPVQPEIPRPPPVIEHTGRNLTILENFDDRTAHSKKFSMYFNAKKPPRLTSTCTPLSSTPLSSQQYPTSSASSIMLSIKIKHNQLTH